MPGHEDVLCLHESFGDGLFNGHISGPGPMQECIGSYREIAIAIESEAGDSLT